MEPRIVAGVPDDPVLAFNALEPERQDHVLKWISDRIVPIASNNPKVTTGRLRNKYKAVYAPEDRYLTQSEMNGAMLKAGYKAKPTNGEKIFQFNVSENSPAFK